MEIDPQRIPRLYKGRPRLLEASIASTAVLAATDIILNVVETITQGDPVHLINVPIGASMGYTALSVLRNVHSQEG
jgi:hypothetical protein